MLKYLAGTNSKSRTAMNALITHVDEHGFHPKKERYNPVEGPLVEFKVKNPKAIRVLAYKVPGGGHVMLLGFDKVDGPTPPAVMRRARNMVDELEKGGVQLD